ncbi:hypothetical protein I3760_12G020000 [Carya illinoinensis]|nr:hypothetical protein I3760_12G020000 [Carya illinoinensis]
MVWIVKNSRRARLPRGPPRIACSPTEEVPVVLRPTRGVRDKEDPIVDAAPKVVQPVAVEDVNNTVEQSGNGGETFITGPPIKSLRRGRSQGPCRTSSSQIENVPAVLSPIVDATPDLVTQLGVEEVMQPVDQFGNDGGDIRVPTLKSGRRGRLPRGPPRIAASQNASVSDVLPPRRGLRDEEDSIVDAAPEAITEVSVEDARNVVQQDGNEGGDITGPPIKKRGRGPAKGTAFEQLRKLGKIPVNIKDGHRGPSCEHANVFSSRVSWIVKVHADMKNASWSVVPDKHKHELINRVRADFILDWTKENHREAVVNALADKYNAYHYELHKHYRKYGSHEEALAGQKSSVEPHVWEWLCSRWASSSFKEQSNRNTNNRKKQKVKHTGGRKSFVRILEEKSGEAPNMIAFYKETHWSREKGKWINAAAEHNYNLMIERLNEAESEENGDEAAAEVFKEVLGFKSGYAQGLGHSVIPDPSPSLKKNKAFIRLAEENERIKNSSDNYKTQLERILGDMAALRNAFSEHDKQLNMISSQLGTSRESQQETQGDA